MMRRLGTQARRGAIALAVAGLVLTFTQLVLPGSSGPGRGTPVAVLFQGTVMGALTALTAIGLVLIYRTSRIVNFAQAAIGAIGAIFAYNLVIVYNLPYGVAFAAGVLVSAGVAILVELLLRRFFDSPRLVPTILTIGVAALIGTWALPGVASLPIWGEGRDISETFGVTEIVPARSFEFTLGDVPLPFRLGHVLSLSFLAFAALAIGAFFRYTRIGIAVRASSENTERAELLGINVRSLSTVVWTIAGVLAGASLILQGTVESFALGGRGAPSALIAALAAAVVARMRSIPVAVFAALAISVVQAAVGWSFRDQAPVIEAGLFVVIALGLLLQRTTLLRGSEGTSWEATEEVRPMPRELLSVSSVVTWRRMAIGASFLLILALPWMTNSGVLNRASLAAIMAIVLLSLVVLTGWAGQVSLGQFALVAVGSLVGGALTSRADISFWLALPAGAIAAAVVALAIGLPALRIRGLFLAVVTLAFASAASLVLFSDRYFGWLQPENIRRPTLLLVDFEDERSMYYLCVLFLAAVIALVVTLRRSRPGRLMIGLRENETELQAFGINIVRTKLAAFALAGFMCGLAGVLFAHHQRAVGQSAFEAQASIDVFVFAMIGGIGSVSGALLGTIAQAMVGFLPRQEPILSFVLNEYVALMAILYVAPGGLAAIAYAVRDAVLRIVAQRRQLVVPSLFADLDPAAMEAQLIPLGEAPERELVAAPNGSERYRLDSTLYEGVDLDGPGRRAPDERAVLGELAERVGDDS